MKVIEVSRFGGPDMLVVAEVADPNPQAGEALVGVEAADVIFLDTQVRGGKFGEYFTVEPPYVPGGGVGGRVLAVGEGADSPPIGARVVARTENGLGGYAERARIPATQLVRVPDGLSMPHATALIHDGPTALRLVANAAIEPGDRVLVLNAAGPLGALLVQLAGAAGGRVVAAARGMRKLEFAKEQGAQAVVDYSEVRWPQQVIETSGGRPDVVFDGAGGSIGRAAFEITAPGGRFSAHGAPSGGFATVDGREAQLRGVTVRGIEQVQFAAAESRLLIEQALAAAVAGTIRPAIGQTFPLERAADAHAAMEARGVLGKTLLLSSDASRADDGAGVEEERTEDGRQTTA